MPSRFAAEALEATHWRRELHQHPELMYDVHRTAGFVAEKLTAFGCDEVVTGLGCTGVVGLIQGRKGSSPRTIGLRADMDALPVTEATGAAWQSLVPGKMHACGHDGHTAMLLGAAQHLSQTRAFDGRVALVFQPAEEGGAGAKAMLDDGLIERFGIEEVFGMHNLPGLAAGHFALRPGPIMAAADRFDIVVEGRGGHAAKPHECVDPVMIGAAIVTALQTIVSRCADPLEACVVSVTRFDAGSAFNIIPQSAQLAGTVRTLTAAMRAMAQARLTVIAEGIANLHGGTARVDYMRGYPVTVNHKEQTAFAAAVAARVAGAQAVNAAAAPEMGAEDFSYMLEARPGCFIFIGNGNSAGLHHPAFDFNDAIIARGMEYWVGLAEGRLAAI